MNAVPETTATKTRRDGRIAARPTRRTARRDLKIFIAVVVGLSAPFELAIARTQALQDVGGVLLVDLPAYALALALGLVHLDPPSLGPWVLAVVAAPSSTWSWCPARSSGGEASWCLA